ncbi:MAG: hypothetical protein V4541_09015 [Bacteroidota bacterium]
MACDNLKTSLNGEPACFSSSSSATENGKRFSFQNPNRKPICKVHVDDCLIKDHAVKKCDYLFEIDESQYYLVELKGVEIETAIEQILSTYEIVNKLIKTSVANYTGIVVSSAVPKAANQKFKNLQEKTYRDKKLIIKRKQIRYEERI